ncbi:MAG: hypothetical protein HUK08_02345 [Bacteroidaceae bacterium]|nr:hypothetical protein [Bacteroidaceae bacterium]
MPRLSLFFLLFLLSLSPLSAESPSSQWDSLWPQPSPEARPYCRWWWLGSAVDKENLAYLLEEYAKAGIGGLEITPIYGVQGNEENDIPFLSPKWMDMLKFINQKASMLGLSIDMNTGTGWPFGGPEVTPEDAASKAVLDKDGKLTVGKTKQMVKRAAPGGEGLVIDHFNKGAVDRYLSRFTKAFEENGVAYPHNFFNDSYEVYGADWTPALFEEFKKRRGYDLEPYTEHLFPTPSATQLKTEKAEKVKEAKKAEGIEQSARIISYYRQTLGELLLENFTETWTAWAHSHGTKTRNQAHGSPGNLIDIYAAVDIPECEGFGLSSFGIDGLRKDSLIRKNDADLSMLKYASSAAHITGKNLVSAEAFTWLTEHFRTSLSQCKPEIDLFMTAGVNHLYMHGTCYSPKEAPWPGWKFYASVDMSPTNTIWRDAPEMFKYITRCQSFMQYGKPDNDFLVYLPIYDMWNEAPMPPKGDALLLFDIHKMSRLAPRFIASINSLIRQGYDCDYISDKFIRTLSVRDNEDVREAPKRHTLITEGGTEYKALIVPAVKLMPHDVLQKLLTLARQGADIVFLDNYPEDVPGFANLEARRNDFQAALAEIKQSTHTSIDSLNVMPEEMKSRFHLSAIRRRNDTGHHYFISALKSGGISDWVTLSVKAETAQLFNPMTGDVKRALTRQQDGSTQVFLQLSSGESCILQTFESKDCKEAPPAPVSEVSASDSPLYLSTGWRLNIPSLSKTYDTDAPRSWTTLNDELLNSFSGTGTYTVQFTLPTGHARSEAILHLGDVRESARVMLNGKYVAILWAVPYDVNITNCLHPGKNTLTVEVTNLPANRIAALDREGVKWRNFKEINIVDINYKKTTYAHWQPMESGLNSTPYITFHPTPVTINADHTLQTVEGWGVSLCWWAKEAGTWDEKTLDQAIDWLVSPDGLNYNVFRYNIPGGDDPRHKNCRPHHMKGDKGLRAEMKGFKTYPDSPYDWSADEAQIKVLRKIIARCKHYGKQPIIEAFANTPPWWMTVSGCCSGAEKPADTNLRTDCYDSFAQYLVDVCRHFRDAEGIEFHSLDPFNEPNTDYWRRGGNQEGCGFLPADQVLFISKHLAPLLSQSGLKTIISASDDTNEEKSLETFEHYARNKDAMNAITQWNTHSYAYTPSAEKGLSQNDNRAILRDKVKASGKSLWMSETGAGGRGIMGNLGLAQMLFNDMRHLQPTVWCDWQFIDSGDQWCLLTCSGNVDRYLPPIKRSKNYYVRAQITQYITPGYRIVETSNDNVLAATSPDGNTIVVCLINRSPHPAAYSLNIPVCDTNKTLETTATITSSRQNMEEFPIDNLNNISLPPRSIVSIKMNKVGATNGS